jgi:hypothetical protein
VGVILNLIWFATPSSFFKLKLIFFPWAMLIVSCIIGGLNAFIIGYCCTGVLAKLSLAYENQSKDTGRLIKEINSAKDDKGVREILKNFEGTNEKRRKALSPLEKYKEECVSSRIKEESFI